jgi:hypothetical protein
LEHFNHGKKEKENFKRDIGKRQKGSFASRYVEG